MDTLGWEYAVASAVVSSALTGAGCRWWFRRQLAVAAAQLERCDKARQFSVLQTMQARKQIERMQKEQASSPLQRQPESAKTREQVQPTGTARIDAAAEGARAPLPSHGFADTERL